MANVRNLDPAVPDPATVTDRPHGEAGDRPVQWGVRHAASPDQVSHIDPRADRADAIHWRDSLRWCGNRDAELVVRHGDGSWRGDDAGPAADGSPRRGDR
ncbi:hypothetical protein ACSNOI_12575 [Actinomadura kijaniata]|uniref:hypothetical protein n=1 Tax=Actinomadura kijaniata TaxID=46161 RepID=UPI003F1D4704